MDEEFYNKLKERILPYFGKDDGHGFGHTQRVLKNALIICKNENIDLDILKTACLLHDVARAKETDTNGVNHAEEGAKMAKEILRNIEFPDDKIDAVAYAISVHRYSKGLRAETREAEILQDADRLEALGAMILVRMFQHAFKNGSPFYDPNIPPDKYYTKSKTVINHIYEKILKIKPETFKTEMAREMARERYKLVEDFAISFAKEWDGGEI